MLLKTLLMAIALMMILEGIMPFIAPGLWRRAVTYVLQNSSNKVLRFIGLTSMLLGLVLLYIVH